MSELNGHIHIKRIRDNGIQTIGRAKAEINGSTKLEFVTLERSWILNEPFISCIDIGSYDAVKRHSSKYGDHFKLLNVEGRSYILMHALNFFNETQGCIGVGERFELVDSDQYVDVINSQNTLAKLNDIMPERFEVTIEECRDFQRMYVMDQDWTACFNIKDFHKEVARREK